jgi:hypothetical protein
MNGTGEDKTDYLENHCTVEAALCDNDVFYHLVTVINELTISENSKAFVNPLT